MLQLPKETTTEATIGKHINLFDRIVNRHIYTLEFNEVNSFSRFLRIAFCTDAFLPQARWCI